MSICISLDLYFEMGPPMSENQVQESQSHVASHGLPRRGMGRYRKVKVHIYKTLTQYYRDLFLRT